MSTASTPSRLGRGVEVPGIDTKELDEKTSTAFSYPGFLTPLQSPHESRQSPITYPLMDAGYHPAYPASHFWVERSGSHGVAAGGSDANPSSPLNSASMHAGLYQSTNGEPHHADLMAMYGPPSGSQEHVPWGTCLNITLQCQCHGAPAVSSNPPPLHVVPSQLSPVDHFGLNDCSDYSSPQDSSDSFSSTDSSFPLLHNAGPQSPDVYLAEEDWVLVRPDQTTQLHNFATPEYPPMQQVQPRAHQQRRTTKRGKGRQPRESYVSQFGFFCELEGKACGAYVEDVETGRVIYPRMRTSVSKPYVCMHMLKNGEECLRGFERSEHLKRHQQSHSEKRPFKCMLRNCRHEKGIGRTDNASDHFKTHLKRTPKGRRNGQYDWPEVKTSIVENFDERTATKFIINLERWIRNKPDGEYQRQFLGRC